MSGVEGLYQLWRRAVEGVFDAEGMVGAPNQTQLAGRGRMGSELTGVVHRHGLVLVADQQGGFYLFSSCDDMLFDDGFEALGATSWSATQP